MTTKQMSQTLTAVATEVTELAVLGDQLQILVSSALMSDGATHAAHMREFQAIDLLVQRLQGVSVFMHGLARATPADWRLDAAPMAAQVALADLGRRLTGEACTNDTLSRNAGSVGDCELFG